MLGLFTSNVVVPKIFMLPFDICAYACTLYFPAALCFLISAVAVHSPFVLFVPPYQMMSSCPSSSLQVANNTFRIAPPITPALVAFKLYNVSFPLLSLALTSIFGIVTSFCPATIPIVSPFSLVRYVCTV